MSPGSFVRKYMEGTLLSLCCGIGVELRRLDETQPITAVDIYEPYTKEFKKMFPWADVHTKDVLEFLKEAKDNSYDVISCMDGIEHLTKEDGYTLLKEMKRVCSKKALIFTPDRHTKNEPKNTWDIPGGDHYQLHLSGWPPKDLEAEGFKLVHQQLAQSAHNEIFNESFYVYNKEQS